MLAEPVPVWQPLVDEVRDLWGQELPDQEWVVRFLKAVGSDPDQFPPDLLAAAVPLVPVFRRGRPFFDTELPLPELAVARFPKLVVSGGHSAGFDAMCDVLAQSIGASRAVIEGAGHEIQFTGQPINEALLSLVAFGQRATTPERLAPSPLKTRRIDDDRRGGFPSDGDVRARRLGAFVTGA